LDCGGNPDSESGHAALDSAGPNANVARPDPKRRRHCALPAHSKRFALAAESADHATAFGVRASSAPPSSPSVSLLLVILLLLLLSDLRFPFAYLARPSDRGRGRERRRRRLAPLLGGAGGGLVGQRRAGVSPAQRAPSSARNAIQSSASPKGGRRDARPTFWLMRG